MAPKIESLESAKASEIPAGTHFGTVIAANDVIPHKAFTTNPSDGQLPFLYLAGTTPSDAGATSQPAPEQRREGAPASGHGDTPKGQDNVTTDKDGNRTTTRDQDGTHSEVTVDPRGREIHRQVSSPYSNNETTITYDQNGNKHEVTRETTLGVLAQSQHETITDTTKNGWTKSESVDGKPLSTITHENTADGFIETTSYGDGTKTTTQHRNTDKGWSEHTTVDGQTGRTTMDRTYDRTTNRITDDRVYPNGSRTHSVDNPDVKII